MEEASRVRQDHVCARAKRRRHCLALDLLGEIRRKKNCVQTHLEKLTGINSVRSTSSAQRAFYDASLRVNAPAASNQINTFQIKV